MKSDTNALPHQPLTIKPPHLLAVLMAINVFFVVAALGRSHIPWFGHRFDLSDEANFPAWWSGLQLALIGLPALVRGIQLRMADRRSHWKLYLVIAAGFVFLSADEICQIHETLNYSIYYKMRLSGYSFQDERNRGLIALILYAVAGLFFLVVMRRDFRALFNERVGRRGLIVGLLVYAAGAVLADNFMPDNEGFDEGAIALEEGLEMAGASILLVAFMVKMGAVELIVSQSGDRSLTADLEEARVL